MEQSKVFKVKINKKGNYKLLLRGNRKDIMEAIVTMMSESKEVEELITISAQAFAELKVEENKKPTPNDEKTS